MRGKNNNNNKKSAPRRRRRNNNGSTVARNQTKYHRQYIGFETTFTLEAGQGMAMPIAPGNYNPAGTVPTTAYSEFFVQRFGQAWKGYRVLGWKATVIAGADRTDVDNGLLGVVPFNQSVVPGFPVAATISDLTPISIPQLCELPNVKMLSSSTGNAKNRASFSYFQGRRDINSLPFQAIIETVSEYCVTGLQFFYEQGSVADKIIVRLFGNMLVEFKDPAFYRSPGLELIDDQQQQEQKRVPYAKRLERITLN